jgi:hypothetical protein
MTKPHRRVGCGKLAEASSDLVLAMLLGEVRVGG